MVKVVGVGDVLRCLARNIVWRLVKPGVYECDCNATPPRTCIESGQLNLCIALRNAVGEEMKGRC